MIIKKHNKSAENNIPVQQTTNPIPQQASPVVQEAEEKIDIFEVFQFQKQISNNHL